MQINDLPAGVLALCLGKLDDPRDLARASCCCKLWKEHANCSPSWRHFCAQWLHWTAGRYDALQAAGHWKAAYRQRLEARLDFACVLQLPASRIQFQVRVQSPCWFVRMYPPPCSLLRCMSLTPTTSQTGKQAVAALQQLVFPLRRYAALQTLIRLGDDAKVNRCQAR